MIEGKTPPKAELNELAVHIAERYRQLMDAIGTNDHAEALAIIRQWKDNKKATG